MNNDLMNILVDFFEVQSSQFLEDNLKEMKKMENLGCSISQVEDIIYDSIDMIDFLVSYFSKIKHIHLL